MGRARTSTVAEIAAQAMARLSPSRLPEGMRRVAEDLVLDVFGLCLAARGSDYVRAALAGWDAEGDGTVIGEARRLSATGAALVNGTAAHGEDFDDTFEGGPVHAGAVVVPAVLAAAERFGADGPAVLLGIAIGVETTCRLSLVAPKRVHQAGFHPTSVFGAMAAAAGVSATLGLDERQIVDAWGIAGSMAGGIIEYLADGAWTKRLHAGWAAQAGLQAALLARAGFTGPRSVFEGTHGLFNGFARGIAGDDIADIVCEVAEGTVHRLWEPLAQKHAPPNPYAAKFSVPFCIAVGFVTGDAGLAAFSDETLKNPRIRALAAKVRYVVDSGNPYPARYTGHVRATLADGSVVEERQANLRGGAQQPLSRTEIEAKFLANADHGGWPRPRAEEARNLARRLFDGPVDLGVLRG
ncbi:MAG TPA: MmgE/PrpD family protein [Stellaceae bacterium]